MKAGGSLLGAWDPGQQCRGFGVCSPQGVYLVLGGQRLSLLPSGIALITLKGRLLGEPQ